MTALTDFTFPHSYHCEVLDELPGTEAPRRQFFPGDAAEGQDGLLVRVTPDGGEPWIGTFAAGRHGRAGTDRVLALPDAGKLCVVSRGAGYVVAAGDPRSWESVRAVPIIDVRVVPAAGLVVFANFTEMMAYGAQGVRWRTKRLAWDNLKVVKVSETAIIGEYWDIREDAMARFEVDLETGAQRGGVED
jgi:hypothetical protein